MGLIKKTAPKAPASTPADTKRVGFKEVFGRNSALSPVRRIPPAPKKK